MNEQTEKKQTVKKHRSPPYPAISLSEALAMVKRLYASQKRSLIHVDAVTDTLGYSPKSGSGFRAVAAMIAFGLLNHEGTGAGRKARISELGYQIIHLEDNDPDRLALLRKAALLPKLYRELVQLYDEVLPPDTAIRKLLVMDRAFNPESAGKVIKPFRATYEYAKLGSGGIMSDGGEDTGNGGEDDRDRHTDDERKPPKQFTPPKPGGKNMRSLAIPLGPDTEVTIHYPANLSSEDFEFFTDMLDRFKSRIVADADPEPEPITETGSLEWPDLSDE